MDNIILIGMPAVGKSTVGVIVAKRLGYNFVDTDLVIQEKEGKLLREIIAEVGPDGFLEVEDRINAEIEAEKTVIAPGGSVVYCENAMKHYKEIGKVVYLQVSFETINKRLRNAKSRGVVLRDGQTLKDLYEERVKNNHIKNLYFDFNQYVKNFTRGQTPFTPAVGVCLEMNKALHLIEEEGFENYLARIDSVAKDFRNRIKELPVSLPAFTISNAVTPIRFEQPIAKDVFTILKDKYDIFVNPTGGVNEDYVLRVAHIGDTTIEDNKMLVETMKSVIKEITGK